MHRPAHFDVGQLNVAWESGSKGKYCPPHAVSFYRNITDARCGSPTLRFGNWQWALCCPFRIAHSGTGVCKISCTLQDLKIDNLASEDDWHSVSDVECERKKARS
ncbi:hypothetical protein BVI2075_230097 [Burkholderia vietnamiensis]|nr:hypothetical protein BVI2075_230097 [Burkholderia vietnamiensis]